MCDVTLVCCWTNEKMYSDLVKCVESQNIPCEIIGIDNRGNKGFTSCAGAYNSVISRVRTKYVIYSHQDIVMNDSGILEKFVSYLDGLGHDDILRVAGVRFDSSPGISNITHRNNQTGEFEHGTTNFPDSGICACDVVDECFFGGHAQHFKDFPFDDTICDNWHLYAAEACLRTKSLCAGAVWVCDIPIIHLSSGTISPSFQYGFYRLCRKYAGSFPFIRTTCGAYKTDLPHLLPSFVYLWCHSMAGVILRKLGLYKAVKKFLH